MKSPRALLSLAGLATIVLLLSWPAPRLHAAVTFTAPELLGRPTADSVSVNVVASAAIDAYFEYGAQPGVYPQQTAVVSAAANEPLVAVMNGLQSNTRYYYRMVYRQTGDTTWTTRDEHAFETQRAPGSTFTFTVTSDSHVNIVFGDANLWQQTLRNVAADQPDFHLDLGDTFAMDNVTTTAGAQSAYLVQRPYMSAMSASVPLFLVLGNHEEEEGWHRDDTGTIATSKPMLGANARKRYFLNPAPDGFYSGNADAWPSLDGDRLPGDYYAWTWGDALFVVIDPYWYSTTKPFVGNTGGGEASDAGSGDRWDWTLGVDQYQWLKQTLETSTATYKFIFAHQVAGGTDDYGRGGANAVPFVEWGGNNTDGKTWAFDTRRAGWAAPVHQLLTANHVTAFFHGHDHEFAYESRDGLVYQLVPMAADTTYGYGFQNYHETDPYTIRVLPNSGHLRVTVSPAHVTVDYVRAFLSGAGTNGQVAYSYAINPPSGDTTPPVISSVSVTSVGSTSATLAWTTDEASDSRVDYGTSASLGSNVSSAGLTTAHSLTLTGLSPATTYFFTVTSKDASGNAATSPSGTPASFATTTGTPPPPSCPCSLWTASTTPGPLEPEAAALELGMKFTSDVAGYVTGVRFYKYAQNTGTHVGSLWSASGTRLGTVTFSSESASGWQTATFAAPVAIAANTTYVISYHTNTGYYPSTNPGFATAVNTPPLHGLADSASGGNGVYAYSASSVFPSQSWQSSNYWVDVVFATTAPTDTTPPVISNVSVTSVGSASATLAWTTDEASDSRVDYGTSTSLGSNVSSAGLTTAHSLTLTGLSPATTYFFTVTSKDASGNAATSPSGTPASFTTASVAPPPICPCSLWTTSTTPGPLEPEAAALELGMKFTSDVAGYVTGVRFYKYAQNTGTHVGNLWSASGTRLGTVTFSGESASGWQTATFATPIAIAANTTYVISYHTNTGYYPSTNPGFATAVNTPPLHGLADGASGGNGVYAYSASSVFPSQSWQSSNYWVDVVFTAP
ncbi:MAG TPA: DUF4082 domain-containing protein [Vicinamibacterales bacterium]|nr:DUF4082 domain-containing protein [Vicinamibacterales bacterium]